MKESCHTSERPMSHIWMHSYVCHDSFAEMIHSGSWSARNYRALVCACVTSLIHTWLIHTCARTHLCVWHDSFIRVPGLIHVCAMTHLYVCHDSFTDTTVVTHNDQPKCLWLWCPFIHECAMTHLYVCHDSFTYLTHMRESQVAAEVLEIMVPSHDAWPIIQEPPPPCVMTHDSWLMTHVTHDLWPWLIRSWCPLMSQVAGEEMSKTEEETE